MHKVSDKVVICPDCGSWYRTGIIHDDDGTGSPIYSCMAEGDVCGNMAMTGPHPERCTPDRPCPGILVDPDRKPPINIFTEEGVRRTFAND